LSTDRTFTGFITTVPMESPGAANSKNLHQSTSVNYSCRRHNATVASRWWRRCHSLRQM